MALIVTGQDYEGGVENLSLSNAAQDLIQFATTAAVPVLLQYIEVTAGTTTQNIMRIEMLRRTSASSSGSGSPTINPVSTQSGAAATTVTTALTTPGSAGSVFGSQNWNVAAPLEYDYTPGGILIPVSSWLVLYTPAAFGSTLAVSIRFKLTELR